ncbi:hypothetical protein [Kribbella sp.]|uniref:hypothetical protein n=1 Tax=Kribbella sp. TaxID=1871183 RepID=UPI002D74C7B5|nr:hypothetical protein [Kribbella sp.]HZX05676.1 hypothetical protein [Kribbella sp.]
MRSVPRCQSCGELLEDAQICCTPPATTAPKRRRDSTESLARDLVNRGLASATILGGLRNDRDLHREAR